MDLSSKQIKAIPYLLAGPTIEIGCQKANISKSQYYEWIKDDDFKTELYRQRNELISQALNLLSSAMIGAVATLIRLLNSKNQHVQRLAARCLGTSGQNRKDTRTTGKEIIPYSQ